VRRPTLHCSSNPHRTHPCCRPEGAVGHRRWPEALRGHHGKRSSRTLRFRLGRVHCITQDVLSSPWILLARSVIPGSYLVRPAVIYRQCCLAIGPQGSARLRHSLNTSDYICTLWIYDSVKLVAATAQLSSRPASSQEVPRLGSTPNPNLPTQQQDPEEVHAA
jgi:hypothetical protein